LTTKLLLELRIQNFILKTTEKAKTKSQRFRAVKEIMKLKKRFLSTALKMSNMLIRTDRLNLKSNVANIEQI